MMCAMAEKEKSAGRGRKSSGDMLAGLPRTRPQRPSARRRSARTESPAAAAPDAVDPPSRTARPADSKPPARARPGARGAGVSRSGAKAATDKASKGRRATTKPKAPTTGKATRRATGKAPTAAHADGRKTARAGAASKATGGRDGARARAATKGVPDEYPAPRQGFAAESSRSIDPPSGAEVLGSAVQAAGELAQVGFGAVRGALSRLRR